MTPGGETSGVAPAPEAETPAVGKIRVPQDCLLREHAHERRYILAEYLLAAVFTLRFYTGFHLVRFSR